MSMRDNHIDRRTFLKAGTAGAAGATLVSCNNKISEEAEVIDPDIAAGTHRILGRTGLKVSVISFGSLQTMQHEVMQAAFARGVNYIDTARCYKGGNNEPVVGKALQGWRDKVIVATKTHAFGPKDVVFKSVEESLKALRTDYIDILQWHHPGPDELVNDEMKEIMAELKKQGKIRFAGTSTHNKMPEVLRAAADDPDKSMDMVLTTYNDKLAKDVDDLEAAIEYAAKAGLGVVAMKTQKGNMKTEGLGGISPHQAMLKFVLQNPHITCAVPSMVDMLQVKENTEVMKMVKMARVDWQILEQHNKLLAKDYCSMCSKCEGTCPKSVDIPTMNRAVMYHEGYKDLELARGTLREMPREQTAMACGSCASCTAVCANGLDLPSKMERARNLMA